MFDMSISMLRLKAKFPTLIGVEVCAGDQETARRAYMMALKGRGDQVCVVETELSLMLTSRSPLKNLKRYNLMKIQNTRPE